MDKIGNSKSIENPEKLFEQFKTKFRLSDSIIGVLRKTFGKSADRPTAVQLREMFLNAACADDKNAWAGKICLNFRNESIIIRPK